MEFNVNKFDVAKFDKILARGLSLGLGQSGGPVCIEAAICESLGLPHGDDPGCVALAVRSYKIALNDSDWSSVQARAKGLRNLGLAQLGSKGTVRDAEFSQRIAEKTIRIIIPKLLRQLFPNNASCLTAADRCEEKGNAESARAAAGAAARAAAWAAEEESAEAVEESAAGAAARAAESARWAAWTAARAAAWAAESARAARGDEYLVISADLALETLRELKSPGIALL